jgi:hypothetical protein
VDPAALREPEVAPFTDGGDPAWELLTSAERTGLRLANFPFAAGGYLIHLGRGSLAAVASSTDPSHPLYSWAIEQHELHYNGIDAARDRHTRILRRFRSEVGPDLDLVAALRT